MDSGVKSILLNLVEDHVRGQGLAYWFIDDGGKLDYSANQGKGIVLNTQCFTKSEVESLAAGLQNKFDLITSVLQGLRNKVPGLSLIKTAWLL